VIVTSARQFLEVTVRVPSRSPTCDFEATGVLRTVTVEASSAVWPIVSRGGKGTQKCATDAAGRCGVYRTLSNLLSRTVWTVGGVSHATLVYDPTANTDPDGDSDGTRITVTR
jgi:hypothetical protein